MFTNRVDAGRQLARALERFRGSNAVVLGLPRGGVPVAYEVAMALGLPLDIIVVRKLGIPFQPEVAMGAIGEDGARVVDQKLVSYAGLTAAELQAVEDRERGELESRIHRLRRGRARHDLRGMTAIVVDDGVATGATARVACTVARHLGASTVVLATPVAPPEVVGEFGEADVVECLETPDPFMAVGYHYQDFTATTDDDVLVLLDRAAHREPVRSESAPDCDIDVTIPIGGIELHGHLHLPEPASSVVVFAHGSGSSRHSPRNQFVASVLYAAGLGTLLLDLLTTAEESDRAKVFDIDLQSQRLLTVIQWLRGRDDTANCAVGFFGASTGAGAALLAAASAGSRVSAVVSRGGRVDLAGARLPDVTAPTLLIVGEADELVLDLNRRAQAMLRCPNELTIIEGATHLFEEPGTLGEVAIRAREWFVRYLGPHDAATAAEQADA